MDCSPTGSSVRDSLAKNTGVSCHALLQGIVWTQGSNPHLLYLLHCRRIPYHWANGKAPTEWVGSFQSTEGLYRRKREDQFVLSASAGTSVFSCPGTLVLLVLRPVDSGLDIYHCPSWSQVWGLGLEPPGPPESRNYAIPQHPYWVSQPLIINLYLSLSIYIYHCLLILSSWRTLNNTETVKCYY